MYFQHFKWGCLWLLIEVAHYTNFLQLEKLLPLSRVNRHISFSNIKLSSLEYLLVLEWAAGCYQTDFQWAESSQPSWIFQEWILMIKFNIPFPEPVGLTGDDLNFEVLCFTKLV